MLKSIPRMTAVELKDYISELQCEKSGTGFEVSANCIRANGRWVLVFIFVVEGDKFSIAMSSQREKTRTFATLESARKACHFVGAMTVIGA